MNKIAYLLISLSFVIGITIGSSTNVIGQQTSIPSWVKNTAKWWGEGQISDADFIKAIQWLINQGILVVPQSNTSNQSTPIPQGFQTYTNNPYQFSIQYPQDWISKEGINGKVDIGSTSLQLSAIVVFVPSEETNNQFVTNVNVKTFAGINGTSLDDLLASTKSGIQQLFSSDDFKEIDEGKITVNGNNAVYLEYVVNVNGSTAETKQILIPNGDTAYIITYVSTQDKFNTYLQQFNAMMSTFKFTT